MPNIVIFQLDNFKLSPFSRNLYNLAPELQKRGYNITLVTTSNLGMESLPTGVRGHVLGQWAPSWLKLPRHYLAIPQFAGYMRRQRTDSIIARGVPLAVASLMARMLSGTKPQIITTLHSDISGDINSRAYRSWRFFKFLASFVINHSDHTVAVSTGVAQDFAKVTKTPLENIKVIYNPVVGSDLIPMASEPLDEPWLAPDRNYRTLLHVGRFAPEKDHETLLQALAVVRRSRDVRLLLIGDGPMRSSIEKSIARLNLESCVKMLGRQENPFSYMAHADALVLTSRFEGLPGVLIQAMALGCPVASTDIPGSNEILEGGRFGPLTKAGDHILFAKSICEVLDSPVPSESLVTRAMRFNPNLYAEKITQLLP